MSCTIITCLYGDEAYDRFVPRWEQAISNLETKPAEVIIASDHVPAIVGTTVVLDERCDWSHPQPFYLNLAAQHATSTWIWPCDIDDILLPDALNGLSKVRGDVWQTGYLISDGDLAYLPPRLPAGEILALDHNVLCGSSAIRKSAFDAVGGYSDVAYQDWSLWRKLAAGSFTFAASGRPHFRYMRHGRTRTDREFQIENHARHVAEMMAAG